ncbi:MAG: DUF29 domain-containing protein, partial [Acetobacteraceae bacterium]|nr:DUF29 domain-containing protein [Acetobacteraceae bacterium]
MSEYETDIVLWSEHQSELLRRVAAGERVNDQVDWENVIEEIADVGINTVRACRSLLLQALIHMLKAEAWPVSRDAPSWRAEAKRFRVDAADAFAPSMRQKINVNVIYAKAVRLLPETIDGQPPLPVP